MSALFTTSCNEWYNHPLGNNFSLWDGDGDEDRIIVYCEGRCHGGIQVVPTRERQANNGEYVEAATSNNKWIIVKTLQMKDSKENYYFVDKYFRIKNLDCLKANCDSILQSYVMGPFDENMFKERKLELGIDLDF